MVNLKQLYSRERGTCWICNERIVPKTVATRSRMWPLTYGGPNNYANLRIAHLSCNSERNVLDVTSIWNHLRLVDEHWVFSGTNENLAKVRQYFKRTNGKIMVSSCGNAMCANPEHVFEIG